jgi:hypothetical protein
VLMAPGLSALGAGTVAPLGRRPAPNAWQVRCLLSLQLLLAFLWVLV